MSLVSDLKLAQENDDLLSSRHKYIFEVPHNMQFWGAAPCVDANSFNSFKTHI